MTPSPLVAAGEPYSVPISVSTWLEVVVPPPPRLPEPFLEPTPHEKLSDVDQKAGSVDQEEANASSGLSIEPTQQSLTDGVDKVITEFEICNFYDHSDLPTSTNKDQASDNAPCLDLSALIEYYLPETMPEHSLITLESTGEEQRALRISRGTRERPDSALMVDHSRLCLETKERLLDLPPSTMCPLLTSGQ